MPTKLIHNVETGQVTEVEFTDEDIAQRAIDDETIALEEAAKAEKIAAKQAVLNKLGLTSEELLAALS